MVAVMATWLPVVEPVNRLISLFFMVSFYWLTVGGLSWCGCERREAKAGRRAGGLTRSCGLPLDSGRGLLGEGGLVEALGVAFTFNDEPPITDLALVIPGEKTSKFGALGRLELSCVRKT